MKKLVVFKRISKKNSKPYYTVCEVENDKFTDLGFAKLCDKTKCD